MAEQKRFEVEALKDHIGPDGRGLLPGRREVNGETVEGAVYEINEADARKLADAGIVELRGEAKAKKPAEGATSSTAAAAGTESDDTDTDAAEDGEWTMRMSPEMYLKQHPDGPHAALARRIVEKGETE